MHPPGEPAARAFFHPGTHLMPSPLRPQQFLSSLIQQLPAAGNRSKRVLILAMLTGRVPAEHRSDLIAGVLTQLGAIANPADRSAIWLALAQSATGNQQAEFHARSLEAACAIGDDDAGVRKEALAEHCRSAPVLLLHRISGAIRDEQHPTIRGELMLLLARRLPEPDRRILLAEILEAILTPSELEHRNGRLPRYGYRAIHLAGRLFRMLPAKMIGRAWELARAIEPLCDWDDAFDAILPYLPDSLMDQAAAEAAGPKRHGGFWATAALADRALGREASLELRTARHLDFHINSRFHLHDLARAAWGQPDERRSQLFGGSLDRLPEIGTQIGRILALEWLIPRLPEHTLDRAFAIAKGLDPGLMNSLDPLCALAARAPAGLRESAIDHALVHNPRGPTAATLQRIAARDEIGPTWPALAGSLARLAAATPEQFLDCLAIAFPCWTAT